MKNCEGCKHDWRLCLTCSRMYRDKWEPKETEMTAEEAEEYLYASQIFSLMTAREKEALLALIREAKKGSSYNPDEWCHDCKEYDKEKHCCPRSNMVIRRTVEELKGGAE